MTAWIVVGLTCVAGLVVTLVALMADKAGHEVASEPGGGQPRTPGHRGGHPRTPGYRGGYPPIPGHRGGHPRTPGYRGGLPPTPGYVPTPDEVRSISFPRAWRGYDPASVDVFLDELTAAYEELYDVAGPDLVAETRDRLARRPPGQTQVR